MRPLGAIIRRWSFSRRNKKLEKRATSDSLASSESGPQVIADEGMDGWALFLHLKNTFGIDNFKIEQRSDSYRVWAPREIRHQDIDSCRL
ncbi:hypothetical protein V8E51_008326 [Hyaloscypha variabilis]